MTIELIFTRLFAVAPYILLKLFSVVLMILHLLFSMVLIRQTKLMTGVVEAKISPTIYAVSIIHMLASLFVLIWAIFVL